MVELRLNARLGNNMFQYAVARLVADGLQCSLTTSRQMYPGVCLSQHFANAPLSIERSGYEPASPGVRLYQHWSDPNPALDLSRIVAHKPETVVVDGYFESYEQLAPFEDELRRIFQRPNHPLRRTVAVHLRLGDVADRIARIPEFADYAVSVAQQYPDWPIDLVVETPTHPFVSECRRTIKRRTARTVNVVWHPDVIDTFDYLRSSLAMIVSNSTFTWWCGFLAPQCQIYVALSARQPVARRNRSLFLVKVPRNFRVFDLDNNQYWNVPT